MATRSNIGILSEDGKIEAIYSHYDGYPSGVGKTLRDHYTDIDKIEELINLGNVSSLDKNITKPEGHSFSNRIDGYTTFYGRDRGDEGQEARMYDKLIELQQNDYTYIWDDEKGKWFFTDNYQDKNKKIDLATADLDKFAKGGEIDYRTATHREIMDDLNEKVDNNDKKGFDEIWAMLYNTNRDDEISRIIMTGFPTKEGKDIQDVLWETAKEARENKYASHFAKGGIPKGATYEYPLYFGEGDRQFVAIWYSFDEDRNDADAYFDRLVEEGAGPDEVLLKTSSGKYKKIDPNDLSDDEYELMNYGLQTSSIKGDKVYFEKGGMTGPLKLAITPNEFSPKVEEILDEYGVEYRLDPDYEQLHRMGEGKMYIIDDYEEEDLEDAKKVLSMKREGMFTFYKGDDPADGDMDVSFYKKGGAIYEGHKVKIKDSGKTMKVTDISKNKKNQVEFSGDEGTYLIGDIEKMKKGGSVEDKEYVLERYYVYVHRDIYEVGETHMVGSWDSSDYGDNDKTFSSKSALMNFIKEVIDRDTYEDNARDDYFMIESDDEETTIDYSVLCKYNDLDSGYDHYEKASDEEIEQWKKGDLELFSVGFTFKVKVYEPRKKAEFAKGGKVSDNKELITGGILGILLGIFLNR